ncbi:metallophosphoesterase [Mesorhizobium sp. CAU 1732]|uniref:metallophosphoesterase n=1 Tax=Mesorhizobium sp. CAU 1732 TaxID=3140358 RepID=UPI0032605132
METGGGVHYLDAAAPAGMRLYAIGDVHGRFDCLSRMHGMIADEIARDRPADWRIIHLGDYVDRGPQSREVLDVLMEATARDPRIIALLGNHDEGFLDFLADPHDKGDLFINYGGADTAASYDVTLNAHNRRAITDSHAALVAAVPDSHVAFLRDLPRSASFGDFFFCHAGVRPGTALAAQNPHDLIWIRREFHIHPGLFDKIVVHGHTPHHEPEVMANRVNVDTMAFETGRLTALVVDGDQKRFIEAAA